MLVFEKYLVNLLLFLNSEVILFIVWFIWFASSTSWQNFKTGSVLSGDVCIQI